MKKGSMHPTWWLLYMSAAVILGLFWLEVKTPLSEIGHTWAEAGLVMILFGLVLTWIKTNEAAFLSEECDKYKEMTFSYTFDNTRNGHGGTAATEGNVQSPDPVYRLEKRAVPAWVLSLLTILIAIFKTQDK